MKFKLDTSELIYKESDKIRLQKLGFEFTFYGKDKWLMKNSNVEIEITSLDELMKFSKEWGKIVLDFNAMSLEICDD